MARKRRAPSPAPPPPPPPQEPSTESDSDTEAEEEESPRVAATQRPPQNPQPHPSAAAADSADSSEEESDSDEDAHAFHMLPVSRSPTKPAAAAPQPESDADEEEEDGESSESEPEVPEPVQKKAAATKKSKTAEPEDKKRPAPESAPSGRAKKVKAEAGKAAPEAIPAGKGKKAKAEPEKVAPQQTPSGKAKKPGGKLEKSGLDSPPPSSNSQKPVRAHRIWSTEDLIKILEAIAAHVKSEGALPKTDVLLSAVCDCLDRKDCNYGEMYERVRRLKERYEKAVSRGVVPSGEDELRMYNLSEAIWGEKAKEAIAAAASQNGSTVTKSKKGQAKKERMDGNSKNGTLKEVANQDGDTQKGSKKGHAIEVKTNRDVKSKLSKEDTTTGSPSKSKKLGNGKEELGKDAKSGTSKEIATTATQNGDALTKRKRGKMDKEKIDVDIMRKEASTGSQNGGTRTEGETHEEETERGASVQGTLRSFDELQNLYPNLAGCVERIEAQHPCGETLRRAFGFIGDAKANALESKVKAQRLLEAKADLRRGDIKKEVLNMLIGLAD